jgi:acyl-CoA reductase-like NAD-dependent aldehyde dehydrogenase
MATTIETTSSTRTTHEVALTTQQLATVRAALEAEIEHATDAARDSDDPTEVARYLAVAERNEILWRQLNDVR